MNRLYDKFKDYSYVGISSALSQSIKEGDMETLTYLLTTQELTPHFNIIHDPNKLLLDACLHGQLEVVQFLLTSPELDKKAKLEYKDHKAFTKACESGNLELIRFFIIDLDYEKNKEVYKILSDHLDSDIVKQAENMFELRNINHDLRANLTDSEKINHTKKLKL